MGGPLRKTPVNRVFMLTAFGVYCWIYPSSVILVMLDRVPPGTAWMASFMLVVGGLVAASWVTLNYGLGRGLLASGGLFGLGLLVEAVGVATGFPFGRYNYTEVLSPKLLGVPVGIIFAWLMVVLSAFFTTNYLWPHLNRWAGLGIAAALALTSDFLMEPVAVYIQNYWTWHDSGLYYGVPEANFAAWGLISLLMVWLLNRLTGESIPASNNPRLKFMFIPPALFLMNLTMFTLVNFSHTNFLAGAIGLPVILACLGLSVVKARKTPKGRPARAGRKGPDTAFPVKK
jgi:putative membrane protein